MRIHPLSHDALQTHTSTHKPNTDEREHIRPCRIRACICDAALAGLPYGDGSGHGEERLDECTEGHPEARFAPELIAETADEGTGDEAENGAESLAIGEVEGVIVLSVE